VGKEKFNKNDTVRCFEILTKQDFDCAEFKHTTPSGSPGLVSMKVSDTSRGLE